MNEWEITDLDTGRTYRLREVNGGDVSGLSAVSGVIAYILMLIGLAIGTISVAEAYPPMLIVLISLDLFALVPIVGYFIAANKRAKEAKQTPTTRQTTKNKSIDLGEAADKAVAEGLGETLSLWKYMGKFILKYGYAMFYAALVAYWVLFFCKAEGVLTMSLMILCMYGMYYFPYLMFSRAAKYKSMFLSVAGLVAIYGGVTATCVAMATLGESFAVSAPVLLPTFMGLAAIVCLPIANKHYIDYGEGKGALGWKKILIILGVSILVIAFILTIISTNMNSKG
jgi:membrane protein